MSTAPENEVLNPVLYGLLQKRFGTVQIGNHGEAMVGGEEVPSPMHQAGTKYMEVIHHPGEYYRVCCPFCDDARYRLWLNHRWGTMQRNNNRRLWLAVCYNENCLSAGGRILTLADMVFGFRNRNDRNPLATPIRKGKPVDPNKEFKLPGLCMSLRDLPVDHPAILYLGRDRGFDIGQLADDYKVSFCTQALPEYGVAEGRIIIPLYIGSELKGWQARLVGDPPPQVLKSHGRAKYYGCPGMRKAEILYNFNHAAHFELIVITEGVSDVWRLGQQAVAVLGSTLSYAQRTRLLSGGVRRTFAVFLDPDAREKQREVVETLRIQGNRSFSVEAPKGMDPAAYTAEAAWNLIRAEADRLGLVLPQESA